MKKSIKHEMHDEHEMQDEFTAAATFWVDDETDLMHRVWATGRMVDDGDVKDLTEALVVMGISEEDFFRHIESQPLPDE